MVDQAAKNGVIEERRSVVENVKRWAVIDKETKDKAYAYLEKATSALAYFPLAIVAFPIVAFAVLIAANISLLVVLPLAVWWGAFAYWFPQRAQRVANFLARTWELIKEYYNMAIEFVSNFSERFFTFVLRVRETVRALLWDNLRTPSTFKGEPLAPFFPELIESTSEFLAGGGNALPQAADIKRVLADYLPERITRNIKDF